jgi:hypothetical protein
MDQVARNQELLDIARDCFHFVTEFFEPINASATHIYHSALELSPLSSIVRGLYYHQQHTPLPRVVVGSWDSWDQGTAIGRGEGDASCTWSPCGRFIAIHGQRFGGIVEIRDGLTLQLLSTLTSPSTHLIGGPTYSPDGRSLASLSVTSLIIWDTQTGGVTKEIKHSVATDASLVWSLDGGVIGTIFHNKYSEIWTVCTCNIASGLTPSSTTLQSTDNPHIWAHGISFQVMTTGRDGWVPTINIFEVGSVLTKIESFQINLQVPTGGNRPSWWKPFSKIKSFSPTTYRVSVHMEGSFAILDIQSSEYLLEQEGQLSSDCFSPDGTLFAAFWGNSDNIQIWKYTSGHYTTWKELWLWTPLIQYTFLLHFSPASSSILGSSADAKTLRVFHLDGPPTSTPPQDLMLSPIPHCCTTYIVTGNKGNSTVTITSLLSQTLPYVINTDMEIEILALTGNILLVADSTTIAAWQLTEEGVMDGVLDNRRTRCYDQIWTLPRSSNPEFAAQDRTIFVKVNGTVIHIYHAETGKVLEPTQVAAPVHPRFKCLGDMFRGLHTFCNQKEHNPHSNDSWPDLKKAIQKGWAKDPEGKHRMWMPVKWRLQGCDSICWLHHVRTLWFIVQNEPVAIRF